MIEASSNEAPNWIKPGIEITSVTPPEFKIIPPTPKVDVNMLSADPTIQETLEKISKNIGKPIIPKHVKNKTHYMNQMKLYTPCECGSGKKWKFCCRNKLLEKSFQLRVSSEAEQRTHNPTVIGANPLPATINIST